MTKIDIISGFLGAGKTTFIKKMVEEVYKGEKIVLIENEFGEVGIDGGFLKDAGIEINEMNSGCICCSLVGDFDKNLTEVLEKFHPDRILIEPSGVGKLSDVTKSVVGLSESHNVKVNALVTVVNAKKAAKQMKAFGEFFNNQVEHATTVVLSRTKDMDEAKLEACVKLIQEKNDKCAIITTPWDEISGEQILKVIEKKDSFMDELLEEAEHAHHEHDHEHEHHHHDHDEECGCGHDHEHDHHHHEHDEECGCGHDHDHEHDHHHHEHDEECGCGHDHDHEHEHHHHDHDGECSCGCGHDHDHDHHHHHADDIFTSWGIETPHKFTKEDITAVLEKLVNDEAYESTILRAKGMVPSTDGTWIYFDMVPGEYEIRDGEPDYTGRLVVIGTDVEDSKMKELFGI